MNSPTHILSGLLLGQAALTVWERARRRPATGVEKAAMAAPVFVAATFSHLGLDAIPHWFWVGHIGGAVGLPAEWLWRAAFAGLLCLLPVLTAVRRDWFYFGICAAGGLFPDMEKAAYFLGHWPPDRILFPAHSMAVSNHTGGLPMWALVTLEVVLAAAMVLVLRWLHRLRQVNHEVRSANP